MIVDPRSTATLAGALAVAAIGSARCDYPLPPRITGNLYVSSFGTNEVFCYSPEGVFLFTFGHRDLRGPRGLAFAPSGDLYVASQDTDRIIVFGAGGAYRRQFAAAGLEGPTGIAIGPDGKLYVSSFHTDEIFVFSGETYERRFSAMGLNGPNCVAFGPGREILVASQLDDRVYRFDPSGAFLDRFTGEGLSSPMGVAIYGERIYVTGGASDTVAVFDLTGNHLGNIDTNPPVPGPQGIAFDDEGNFATTSFFTGEIALFRRDGTLVKVLPAAGIQVGRSLAYLPVTGEGDAPFVRGDFNRDGTVDIGDAIATLDHLFGGVLSHGCLDAGDANDDGALDIGDAIYSLNHLFAGGPAPPPPFPEPGADPTRDDLVCPPGP